MATVNLDEVNAFLASLPKRLEANILRGAMRAGAVVIADAARENCRSEEVRESIGVSSTSARDGVVTVKVQTKGAGAYLAPWLEHGTDPHFISVDAEQSGGRTIKRVNKLANRGELVINGNFAGEAVHHPGAKPYPFMRPAADNKQDDAIAAIGNYITTRATKEGLAASAPSEPDE